MAKQKQIKNKNTKLKSTALKLFRIQEKSEVLKFRNEWLAKGFDLINITTLCEFKLGHSGDCSHFNEPQEEYFHIQCWYRDEEVAIFSGKDSYVVDEDKYVIWISEYKSRNPLFNESEFIIFRLVPIIKEERIKTKTKNKSKSRRGK